MTFRAIVAALVLAFPWAAAATEVRITNYGEFVFQSERPSDEPGEITESNIVEQPRFVHRTTQIPGRLCVHFGIEFEAVPPLPRPVDVILRLTHPMMVNPDGRRGTTTLRKRQLTTQSSMTGFGFDRPWEIVPGTWTFSVLDGDRVLAEQSFEVLDDAGGGPSRSDCERPIS